MIELKTTAAALGKISDCRDLFLEMEFHLLTREQTIALCELCFQHTYALLEESFFAIWSWKLKKTSIRTIPRKIKAAKRASSWIGFGFEAAVISDIVYNLRTYYQYCLRFYSTQPSEKSITRGDACIDYAEMIFPKISSSVTPEQYKEIAKEVFRAEGKYPKYEYWSPDTMGLFTAQHHKHSSELYYGNFTFRISYSCLSAGADIFAEKLTSILKQASEKIESVSGRVGIKALCGPSPYSSHMIYFGHDVIMDDSHIQAGVDEREWYPNYYFCGVEWFNLLSPLQLQHLPNLEKEAKTYPEITIQHCEKGGVIVQSNQTIALVDVDDLLPVKKLIYDALYPGKQEFLLEHFCNPKLWVYWAKPRCKWECVPVLDEEIVVTEKGIVLQHAKHNSIKKSITSG